MSTTVATSSVSSALPDVQPKKMPRFTRRQMRALWALWNGPLMREKLDHAAGASNSPQLISDIVKKGVEIKCNIVEVIDRDGHKCRSGLYSLTDKGRATLQAWGWGMTQ